MPDVTTIPMFPLSILPLPGELVPLHIFEPRYQQLLQDAENADVSFGIFFNHTLNTEKIGSLMKLESVIKRYPGGESDIIVKCVDIFYMDTLFRTFKSKMYPGGDVRFWRINDFEMAGAKLGELFQDYLVKRKITRHQGFFSIYSIAQELSLDLGERYAFLTANEPQRERLLLSKIKFQMHLLQREEVSRDSFHLN
ncbi:MAG: hypothetical protein KF725_09770 [Cyclobacteriaceae bacterium]|nr:hypothetical protein [Cyclobacteriaceae bacterium]UYN86002.1 MAG: hypothetical protein KIT51_14165 [Cyclobacteriaceae bacterium]